MSKGIEWRVPPSVLRWLAAAPTDRPVVVLLRHSVRNRLPSDDDAGYALPITKAGSRLAQRLGAVIGERLRTLHSSPLVRCVQTADALCTGAGMDISIFRDQLLGNPGIFVVDEHKARENWKHLGHERVMQHLVGAHDALPGMARPDPAARFLVQHMFAMAKGVPGVHIFVTHDSLLTATAARILGRPFGTDAWPWYLEGAFFWRGEKDLQVAYRDHNQGLSEALYDLTEEHVIEFARREIARTVGLESGAHFFLAGGAFKSLLTGAPPRDLDLWAASDQDRKLLVLALEARHARRLAQRSFADAFEIAGRVIEVPHRVTCATLGECLSRFDIALSAVGVEYRHGDRWSACIHPLARESVRRQAVLLLKPLVNWKYALATLERMRRYAAELGFASPQDEEAEVRRVFEIQSPEMRVGMLERFERTTFGGSTVTEEAACWCQ